VTQVLVARTAAIAKIHAGRFVFLTTRNRKAGGGGVERGMFLVLAMGVVSNKPDVVAVVGLWCIDKEDFDQQYDVEGIMRGDPESRRVYKAMTDADCMVDVNWRDTGGLCEIEPYARVARRGGAAAAHRPSCATPSPAAAARPLALPL
jgi:hypothetical protein